MFEYHKKESPIISLLGMGGGIGYYSLLLLILDMKLPEV